MSQEDLHKRLDDLEVKFAFQEDTIHQLDQVIQEQATEIHALKSGLKTIREQMKETLGPEAPPEEQVPPHY